MLDKAIHLIIDLISFVPLYVNVQPHLHVCKWHPFYQQLHVSLTFLIILVFNLVQYDVKLFEWYPPENVNVFGNEAKM